MCIVSSIVFLLTLIRHNTVFILYRIWFYQFSNNYNSYSQECKHHMFKQASFIMNLISLTSYYTNYTLEDIFVCLIWLTCFTTCYFTYTCHRFTYETVLLTILDLVQKKVGYPFSSYLCKFLKLEIMKSTKKSKF